MDVGEQLTKSRELQQNKGSSSGHIVPVQPKLVPVQLIQKLAVDILYRYNLNLYRYNLLEKWQLTYCTGTTQTCTGITCLKINSGEIVPVQLKLVPIQLHGNCGIGPRTRSVREGTLVNEPKWENHIGGRYKSKKTQVIGSFSLRGLGFERIRVFLHFLSWIL